MSHIFNIDESRVLFNYITNMRHYRKPEPNIIGGGSYVDEKGFGHELFNFQNEAGKCYGYTAPYGTVNLRKLSRNIASDSLGRYVDNVLVVFMAQRDDGKRVVVGFYKNARVYEKLVNDKRKSRWLEQVNEYIGYNAVCDAEDAVLIDYDDRNKIIERATSKQGGYGQSNLWYASAEKDVPIKRDIIDYVIEFLAGSHNDERKYHTYLEGKAKVTTSSQRVRSREARLECIRIHGCRCKICGFNFKETYGVLGADFIEVHHITSLGELSTLDSYEGTNPGKDLIPVCPNCHSMLHRRKIPYNPDEIREAIREARRASRG